MNQDTLHQILHMLWVFAQLSVLGFGGGKGIIPQMHVEVVDGYQWVTNDQFTQFYTIGKLVPGPTTIFAALIGYAAMPQAAVLGALIATIGMFVPSSMIMVGVGHHLGQVRSVSVARDRLPRPRAGDRRSRLGQRLDHLQGNRRRADSVCDHGRGGGRNAADEAFARRC